MHKLITQLQIVTYSNTNQGYLKENTHYVTIFFQVVIMQAMAEVNNTY